MMRLVMTLAVLAATLVQGQKSTSAQEQRSWEVIERTQPVQSAELVARRVPVKTGRDWVTTVTETCLVGYRQESVWVSYGYCGYGYWSTRSVPVYENRQRVIRREPIVEWRTIYEERVVDRYEKVTTLEELPPPRFEDNRGVWRDGKIIRPPREALSPEQTRAQPMALRSIGLLPGPD